MRADAAATLYLFQPLRRILPANNAVPILMYHSISDRQENGRHPYYCTVTSPQMFAEQMAYLHAAGYSTMRVGEVEDFLRAPQPGRRPVVITFDDGFEDVYTHAAPILNQFGFTAVVYLPTAYIGTANREFLGAPCLTWPQIRELQARGIEFGSHTVTHPQLKSDKIKDEDVRYEIRCSKDTIEQALGHPVTSFAYPYAFPETDRAFTRRLREILDAAGYDNGVCTMIGTADRRGDRYFRKRIPVNGCDDTRLLQAKLDGGYDWLHSVQFVSKLISNRN